MTGFIEDNPLSILEIIIRFLYEKGGLLPSFNAPSKSFISDHFPVSSLIEPLKPANRIWILNRVEWIWIIKNLAKIKM